MKKTALDNAKRCSRAICACAAALVGVSAFASGWTWSGKTGDVTITAADSPVNIADADVATVNALSSLTVESGAVVNMNNTSSTLEFGATPVLLGVGTINGAVGAKANFSGDARGFTGTFDFDRSWITVTSEWGLGEATVKFNAGAYQSTSARLRFTAGGTNCHATVTVRGWTDKEAQRLSTADETVTFQKDFTIVSTDTSSQYFFSTVFNGTFTAGKGNLSFANGKTTVFNRDVRLRNMVNNSIGKNFWVSANTKVYINATGNQWENEYPRFCGEGILYFGANNAWDGSRAFCTLTDASNQVPKFDLQGHSQECAYISNYDNNPANIPNANFPTFTSATPATITMTANGSYGAVVKFSGKVSHRHTGAGTYTMYRCYSDTEGLLRVDDGAVKLDGGGWGGDVKLSGDARLIVTNGATLGTSRQSVVEMAAASSIEIQAGHVIYCDTLIYDGVTQEPGIYDDGFVTGGGSLVVGATTWSGGGSGWDDPDSWTKGVPVSGGKVVIPAGAVVGVSDDDALMVSSLGSIILFGEMLFTNSSNSVTLDAELLGSGGIRAQNAAGGLEISGDNRNLTGAMWFSNTPVTVSGRYALGSSARSVTHIDARLLFKGEGLTNDVPLRIEGDRKTRDKGFTDNGDRFVQNGNVTLYTNRNNDPLDLFLENIDFNGNVSCNGIKGLEFTVYGVCRFNGTFYAGAQNVISWNLAAADSELHMHKRDGFWAGMTIYGPGKYICDGEDALCAERVLRLGSWSSGHLDLNGFDQQARELRVSRGTSADVFTITSSTPAQIHLTLDNPGERMVPISFQGAAGLDFGAPFVGSAVADVFALSNVVSETTGLLSTTNGTVVSLVAGAAWYGDLLVDGAESRIILDSRATLNPKNTSTVTVRNGGKLQIDGRRIRAGKFIVDGVEKAPGAYTAANCANAIVGAGSLVVANGGFMMIFR